MKTGLIGYGKMGKGIFNLLAGAGLDVIVNVRSPEKADAHNAHLEMRLKRLLRQGLIDEPERSKRATAQRFTCRLRDFEECQIIIEAIPEDPPAKTELFCRLEEILPHEAILVSNTSSLSIGGLGKSLKAGERFCGLHFFHPIPLTGIIEIIRWKDVSPETVLRLEHFCRNLGRFPISVMDTPGSALNFVLGGFYCEALYLLEQGLASPSHIDHLAGRFCRVGPCESLDSIGLKFFAESFQRLAEAWPRGIVFPAILDRLVGGGRIGREHGNGIFTYGRGMVSEEAGGFYLNPDQAHSLREAGSSDEILSKRLFLSLLIGALTAAKRKLASPADLNLGIKEILGMNQGPFDVMRSIGKERMRADFHFMERSVGARFDSSLLDEVPEESWCLP